MIMYLIFIFLSIYLSLYLLCFDGSVSARLNEHWIFMSTVFSDLIFSQFLLRRKTKTNHANCYFVNRTFNISKGILDIQNKLLHIIRGHLETRFYQLDIRHVENLTISLKVILRNSDGTKYQHWRTRYQIYK